MTISQAKAFVDLYHRHHIPPVGGLFAVGVDIDQDLCGVALVDRPVARMLQDGFTCEVTRVCTDGTKNACSMLLGAARRAANALGYRRIYTYTLPEEGGASLRAAGFKFDLTTEGGSWSTQARPRIDKHPLGPKVRWVSYL